MEFDKSRVYTALNADELKVGDKVYVADNLYDLKYDVENDCNLAVIQGIHSDDFNERFKIRFVSGKNDEQTYCLAYLVERAKEKKYRPYESIDEFVSDFIKRFNTHCPNYAMPLIWVKRLSDCDIRCITTFSLSDSSVVLGGSIYTMEELFKDYGFIDNTPCGKEIED